MRTGLIIGNIFYISEVSGEKLEAEPTNNRLRVFQLSVLTLSFNCSPELISSLLLIIEYHITMYERDMIEHTSLLCHTSADRTITLWMRNKNEMSCCQSDLTIWTRLISNTPIFLSKIFFLSGGEGVRVLGFTGMLY